MKISMGHYRTCFYIILALLLGSCKNHTIQVSDLQTCNLSNPEGIDVPSLSWKIESTQEGIVQSAWEVEMASTQELLIDSKADVWKSGRQESPKQFEIRPEGVPFSEATAYYWRVRIWDDSGKRSAWSEAAYFSIGLNSEQSWKASWITYSGDRESALPYFRKVFDSNKEGLVPVKATVYLCGLGCSELYLNGQKVDSTRFLDPAQSNYEQYALYSAFDVTEQLKEGNNCVGVMLGNGWFAQDAAWNGHPFAYGSPMLRLQLDVIYSDGSRKIIGTDDSWKWTEGPVLKTNLYLGELYDARKEIIDWCKAEKPDADWKNAVIAASSVPPRLQPQLMQPIRTKQVLKAVDMWQDPSGSWIFDFGVNLTGIPQLSIQQAAGTHLSIRMAEEKKADGSLDFTTLGWKHHGKVFSNEYICKGEGMEQWSPRFTYHGFRYAELSGMQGKPDLSALNLIVVHSDLQHSGSFECSDPQINKLHEMAMHTVLSNLHGVPTDCPDREKCGWLGDCHAYVKMTNLNLQMNNFWVKYLEDIRSGASVHEQNTLFHERYNSSFYFTEKPSGIPYMIAPGKRLCGVASPDWGTALVQLPWWLYVYYGNTDVLRDFYPDMKQWTTYVSSLASDTARTNKYGKQTKHIVYQGLGDWCPPGGNDAIDTPVEFSSTAFHYLDVWIMEKTAGLLKKETDADAFAKEKEFIAAEILSEFYNYSDKTFGSQTANVMALDLGLVPPGDEEAVAYAVVRNMNEKHNGFMHCGIFGIGRIGSMLARNGHAKAAWDMFSKKGEDSFANMWDSADATSLWETLPVNKESQEVAAKASHNHPMQAGYDVCFFEDMAGIRPDDSGAGFSVIRFEPLFTEYLEWAKASVESPYGTIVSSWKIEENIFNWQISIPSNTKGIVAIPEGEIWMVNGAPLNEKKHKLISKEGERFLYQFPSGNFDLQVKTHSKMGKIN